MSCPIALASPRSNPWLSKFMMVAALYLGCLGTSAFALDINLASAQQLMALNGIGSKMAERILQERQRAGQFKSWADVIKRVSGIGPKKAEKLQQAGLRVGTATTEKNYKTAEPLIEPPFKPAQRAVTPRTQPPSRPVS